MRLSFTFITPTYDSHTPLCLVSFPHSSSLPDFDLVTIVLSIPHYRPALPKSCGASSHDLSLTDQLCIELAAVKGEKNVKVDACTVI